MMNKVPESSNCCKKEVMELNIPELQYFQAMFAQSAQNGCIMGRFMCIHIFYLQNYYTGY
jgi:hypothetical protein